MIELFGTIHVVQTVEEWCQVLVNRKQAILVHDSSRYIKKLDGMLDHANDNFNVKVYKAGVSDRDHSREADYKVFVGKSLEAKDVNVRFWYDKRSERAGIKITRDGFMLILKSMTVVGLLRQLSKKVTKNGTDEVDIDLVKEVLTEMIKNQTEKDTKIDIVTA